MNQDHDLVRRVLSACSLDDAAAGFTEGFAGYMVPVNVTAEALRQRILREDVDSAISEVFFDGGRPAGILLIARRGDFSRISALGIGPTLRGKGLGRHVMREAIDAARKRGEKRLLLEVIDSNTRAADLYRSLGFETLRRLVGFERAPSQPTPETAPAEACDLEAVVGMLSAFSDPALTWQADPRCFRNAEPTLKGFCIEGKAAVLVDDSRPDVRINGLAVNPAFRRRGYGRKLVEGLTATYPGRKLFFIEIVPEGLLDPFLSRLGWQTSSLTQSEMALHLS